LPIAICRMKNPSFGTQHPITLQIRHLAIGNRQ
jgi:hypothetical protein